jgi:hypothetical protein
VIEERKYLMLTFTIIISLKLTGRGKSQIFVEGKIEGDRGGHRRRLYGVGNTGHRKASN